MPYTNEIERLMSEAGYVPFRVDREHDRWVWFEQDLDALLRARGQTYAELLAETGVSETESVRLCR